MKLKDLLDVIFNEEYLQKSDGIIDTTLSFDLLEKIKETLMECDEFKDADEFVILKAPCVDNEKNKIIQSMIYKIDENTKFKKRVYLYSVSLTPEIFNPESIHRPVKNGACISPAIYNFETMAPTKKIVLEFSPEEMQDGEVNKENLKRQELHNLLDEVLNNPKDYHVKGEKGVVVRGIFESIVSDGKTTNQEIGKLNLDYENQKNFMVAYMEKIETEGNINISVKRKFIPIEFKKKFTDKFGENPKLSITADEIECFLKDCEEK